MKNPNLNKILKACRRNDRTAQHTLYQIYVDKLYYVVLRYVKNTFDTETILQDVFLKIFKHIASFDSRKASFYTWAKTIAIRESINHCKKKKLEFFPIDELYENKQQASTNLALERLHAEDLLWIISKIPAKYRIIFNLFEIDGLQHQEIADLLEIPIGTSRSYLTRAKKLIQKELNIFYTCEGSDHGR